MGFMKTEQEQIKAIKQIIDERVETTLGQVQGRHGNVIKTVDTVITARDIVNAGYSDVSEYKAEIERLKAENEKYLDSIESVQAGRCRLRCPLTEQAVKEFAERLSVRALCLAPIETYHICNLIDELIKEIRAQ